MAFECSTRRPGRADGDDEENAIADDGVISIDVPFMNSKELLVWIPVVLVFSAVILGLPIGFFFQTGEFPPGILILVGVIPPLLALLEPVVKIINRPMRAIGHRNQLSVRRAVVA